MAAVCNSAIIWENRMSESAKLVTQTFLTVQTTVRYLPTEQSSKHSDELRFDIMLKP